MACADRTLGARRLDALHARFDVRTHHGEQQLHDVATVSDERAVGSAPLRQMPRSLPSYVQ